jgi:parallel beta-helix repeat protein
MQMISAAVRTISRRSLPAIVVPLLLALMQLLGALLNSSIAAEGPSFFAPIVVSNPTYFVALTGNDSGPGTNARPWATINHAAERMMAGDTVIVHGGHYFLSAQVRPRNSGRPGQWISFVGYPGEEPVLDAQGVDRSSFATGPLNQGIFQLEGVAHIRIANLTIINSHDAGFTVRDSSDIELINNTTRGTFSSGIAVWDTSHNGLATMRIRVIGNTVTKATTWDQSPLSMPKTDEPPHEAVSIGGAVDFEVAYNHVFNSDKEGIDIKESSHRGKVHHNLIDRMDRQGIYIDAWFGAIKDIEVFSNVIHDCRGAGIALSVEEGRFIENIAIYQNLIFDNYGSGIYFSRWGADNPRRNIRINKNIIYHNGYGPPTAGQAYYWQTGGLYFSSADVTNVSISNNIFSQNRGFQIGYSEIFLRAKPSLQEALRERKIEIDHNLIFGENPQRAPIQGGGLPFDQVKIYAVDGGRAVFGDPLFKDSADNDFTLLSHSPAKSLTGFSSTADAFPAWWQRDFPPTLFRLNVSRLNDLDR